MPVKKNLLGRKFFSLTVIAEAAKSRRISGAPVRKSVCLCRCGNTKIIENRSLTSGNTHSCGCENPVQRKHGLSVSHRRSYHSWRGMLLRCLDTDDANYVNYGGRGIKVCKRWLRFENFLKDMGDRPDGLTIERKNNNGDYKPSNCKWATPKEQQRNKRNNRIVTFNGVTACLSALEERFGVARHRIQAQSQ